MEVQMNNSSGNIKETKNEKPEFDISDEEIFSRVIPVKEELFDHSESSSDSWSNSEYVGPITTDTLHVTFSENKPKKIKLEKLKPATTAPRKKKKKSSSKKKVVKNQKPKKIKTIGRTITKGDKSYELMFDMLLGIRISVSGVSAKKLNVITRNDFKEVDNYFIPSAGTMYTPAHPGRDFQFTDYAPKVFRDLRERNGIDSADYLISLTADYVLSEIISPGKSGSFFYFSHDTKYMLKTITPSEKQFLKKIIRSYYQHVTSNPDTLVIRFYGFHMVQPHGGPKMHFVVMGNIFAQSLEIQERYDLKGSTTGRTVGEEKLKNLKPTTVLKDLDFTKKLVLGPKKKEILMNQLEADCEYLQKQDIMDYSLLLGIHNKAKAIHSLGDIPEEYDEENNNNNNNNNNDDKLQGQESQYSSITVFTKDHGGFAATDEKNETLPEIYFLGVIDILQPYNISKQVEHNWKSTIMRMNKYEISAVSPTLYAERFLRYMKSHIGTEDAEKMKQLLRKEVRLMRKQKRLERRTSRSLKRERALLRAAKKGNKTPRSDMSESESKLLTSVDSISEISIKEEKIEIKVNGKVTTENIDNNKEPSEISKKVEKTIVIIENSEDSENSCTTAVDIVDEEENEDTIDEIVDDFVLFDVRVPKRKRAKEKSLLNLHALDRDSKL